MRPPETYRRFAWGDLSFEVPADWDLAFHHQQGALTRLRLDDAVAVRLTVEWWRTHRAGRINLDRAQARFGRITDGWRRVARVTEPVAVPYPAEACRFVFSDGREVVAGFCPSSSRHAIALVQMHGAADDAERNGERARHLFSSLVWHESPRRPWAFYDLCFGVPADFRLLRTTLWAGRKELQYGWAGRRLHLAFYSLADHLLRDQPDLWTWAAAEINRSRVYPEVRFAAQGRTFAVRRRLLGGWPLSSLWRRCLRYAARVEHNTAENRVALAVFNYRLPSDLEQLRAVEPFARGVFSAAGLPDTPAVEVVPQRKA